ncbi:hypothetical protein BGP77_15820 [Saccharospirillum sp. MSK14-1]|uniref:hypothetical protein n=1 Tax=Saccharospirillum sp. MSK14-1 TaxID=1897632 RepID=UPI000D3ABB53|nr:hypothetical protein [Saccharospirillum sp. MSK14-1]PTY37927.1 hypothetical protein BGP77_15820 [Saccharospirillum sp. MSK14-1]
MNVSGSLTQWAEQFIQTVDTRRQEAAGVIDPIERTEQQAAMETAMLSGAASKNHLARLVFGGDSQIQQWASQGLSLADETLSAAEEALSQAMAEHEANGSVPSKALFNAYQLIADNQEAPDWLSEEQQQVLANMTDEEAKAAFENGDLYYLTEVAQGTGKSGIDAYQSMQKPLSLIDQLFG